MKNFIITIILSIFIFSHNNTHSINVINECCIRTLNDDNASYDKFEYSNALDESDENSSASESSESSDSNEDPMSVNFEPTPLSNLPKSYERCLEQCNKFYLSITNAKRENEYTILKAQFNIPVINWNDKKSINNRLSEIYKVNKLDASTKGIAKAILLYEKLYNFYNEINVKVRFKHNFIRKLCNFMDWLASKNKNICYLIQMPYIIDKLLHREQLVTAWDLSEDFLLKLSDQIWPFFLTDNDFNDLFNPSRYDINITQQNMNIIKYKTLTTSLNLFKLLCCYEYLQPKDCKLYLKNIKESHAYKTFNKQ